MHFFEQFKLHAHIVYFPSASAVYLTIKIDAFQKVLAMLYAEGQEPKGKGKYQRYRKMGIIGGAKFWKRKGIMGSQGG